MFKFLLFIPEKIAFIQNHFFIAEKYFYFRIHNLSQYENVIRALFSICQARISVAAPSQCPFYFFISYFNYYQE